MSVRSLKYGHWPWLVLFVLSSLLLSICSTAEASKGVYDWAYVRLDYAREEKADQLRRFWKKTHSLARKAAQDASVLGCFAINQRYAAMKHKGAVPEAVSGKVEAFRKEFNAYYIKNYFSFYDLLFVNKQGQVFYTIRKESDLNKNLMHGDAAESPLGQCLRKKPRQEVFVDFHHYGPSAKPAAFFVEPMHKDGKFLGWLVLQCAVNKVNTLFAWEDDLGQTGETFLVNREGFMLTESNFIGDSTILDKHLDDRNIQAKFADEKGHRVVTDYRGRIALSSFEVVHFLGTNWLAAAKMDKAEIITQHYTRHRRYYADKLLEHLRGASPAPLQEVLDPQASGLRVDMDEFLKASNGESLQTIGISTCTGLLATYPGRFAYLAHISPRDKIYGGEQTNLLGQMLKQVKSFDIRPCEKRGIVFVTVAPHLQSLLTIIDKLIQEGFLLSQVRVMFHPQAKSSAMLYDYIQQDLEVVWRLRDQPGNQGFQCMECAFSVGEIIEEEIKEEEGSVKANAVN
ncbi:MAG: cache domain-containing protein [Desulfohalobiaceae bacterium]|nr:cache domain-containing protein [Desulfohalobiaceae bacterium]